MLFRASVSARQVCHPSVRDKASLSGKPHITMTLSAAEKAEQRRQKILAKKKARMAYVAGDSTEPPSSVEPNPSEIQKDGHCEPPSITLSNVNNTTVHAGEPLIVDPDSMSPLSATAPPVVQQITNPFHPPPTLSYDYQADLSPAAANQQQNWQSIILVAMAVVFAAGNRFNYISGWPVSAVELFIYTRLFLELPHRFVGRARFNMNSNVDPHANRSSISTFLDIANNVSTSLSLAYRLWSQFSVYMFVFLLTWYFLQ